MLGRGVEDARGLAAARREELEALLRKRSEEGAGLREGSPEGFCDEGKGRLEGRGMLDGRGMLEGRGMPEGRGSLDEESIARIGDGLGCRP